MTDTSGAFAVCYSYDSWGNPKEYNPLGNVVPLGTFANPYIYKTYYLDTETNLYYLNARYYDSSIGRFLTRDPDSGDDTDRLSKNEYAYGYNNPVNNEDPDGHGFFSWIKNTYHKARRFVKRTYKRAKRFVKRVVNRIIANRTSIGRNTKKQIKKSVNSFFGARDSLARGNIKKAKIQLKKSQSAMRQANKSRLKEIRAAKRRIKEVARKVVNKAKAIGKKIVAGAKAVGKFASDNLGIKVDGKKRDIANIGGVKIWAQVGAQAQDGEDDKALSANVSHDDGFSGSISDNKRPFSLSSGISPPRISVSSRTAKSTFSNSFKFNKGALSNSTSSSANITYDGKGYNVKTGFGVKYDQKKAAVAAALVVGAVVAWPYLASLGIGSKLAAGFTSLFL